MRAGSRVCRVHKNQHKPTHTFGCAVVVVVGRVGRSWSPGKKTVPMPAVGVAPDPKCAVMPNTLCGGRNGEKSETNLPQRLFGEKTEKKATVILMRMCVCVCVSVS